MKLPVNYEMLSTKSRREVRIEYARIQDGLCSHCHKSLDLAPAEYVTKAKINWELFPQTLGAILSTCIITTILA